jgi:hypothetical protein
MNKMQEDSDNESNIILSKKQDLQFNSGGMSRMSTRADLNIIKSNKSATNFNK